MTTPWTVPRLSVYSGSRSVDEVEGANKAAIIAIEKKDLLGRPSLRPVVLRCSLLPHSRSPALAVLSSYLLLTCSDLLRAAIPDAYSMEAARNDSAAGSLNNHIRREVLLGWCCMICRRDLITMISASARDIFGSCTYCKVAPAAIPGRGVWIYGHGAQYVRR